MFAVVMICSIKLGTLLTFTWRMLMLRILKSPRSWLPVLHFQDRFVDLKLSNIGDS